MIPKKEIQKNMKQIGQGVSEYLIMLGVAAVTGLALFGYFNQSVETQGAGMTQALSGENANVRSGAQKATADLTINKDSNTLKLYTEQHSNQ